MVSNSRNILLVYPEFPKTTYWSFSYALPFTGKKATMPPLGLITAAAMLPSRYNVKLIDMNIEKLKEKDIEWADSVWTSSMNIQKESLDEVITEVIRVRSKIQKDISIAAGGHYPTQYFDTIRGVDHFVLGEAESGVLEAFVRDIEQGNAKKAYVRKVIRTNPIERKIDMDEYNLLLKTFKNDADIQIVSSRPRMSVSKMPRFDLLNIDKYHEMAVQSSRGCPHSCDFCIESALFGHEPRLKDPGQFVAELKFLHDTLGYRGAVFVVDDNFIGNERKIKNVLKDIQKFQEERNYPFTLNTEASIKLAKDEELMRSMRDAGFNTVFIGLETPDKNVLKSMNKYHNANTSLLDDVRKIHGYGLEINAGFIAGNDKDPADICDKIFDFCQEAGIPMAMVGLLSAGRGSPLYERLRKEGRLRKDAEGNNTHEFSFNFEPPKGKDETQMIENYKNLLAKLYDKKGDNFFERCAILDNNLGPNPRSAREIRYPELRAGALSLVRQSFFTPYSKNYRKAFKRVLFEHPNLLPEFISRAIMGRHLIKITHNSLKAHKIDEYISRKIEDISERLYSFKNYIDNAWDSTKPGREEFIRQVVEEKDRVLDYAHREKEKFLVYARKRINSLPKDYRPKLIEKYENMVSSLNRLIIQVEYAKL